MLKVEPTGHSGISNTAGGRNGNEAVAGAASEALARSLHRRYAPVELPLAGHIVLPPNSSLDVEL